MLLVYLFNQACIIALFWLRKTKPDEKRSFKVEKFGTCNVSIIILIICISFLAGALDFSNFVFFDLLHFHRDGVPDLSNRMYHMLFVHSCRYACVLCVCQVEKTGQY